jgi:hypothetical protein
VIVHHTEGLPWFPRRELPGGLVGYPYGMTLSLYQACAMDFVTACIWGGLSVRFPNLTIMVAESGGSWLPHLIRRLNFTREHSVLTRQGWPDLDQTPLEMIKRTFAFSTQELDVARDLDRDLGITAWMMEDDYPTSNRFGQTRRHTLRSRLPASSRRSLSGSPGKPVLSSSDSPCPKRERTHNGVVREHPESCAWARGEPDGRCAR